MADYSGVIKELLRGVSLLVDEKLKQIPQMYDGLVVGSDINNKWKIQFNGETHSIPHYGDFSVRVGKVVKVFIPKGNLSSAYFI